MLSSKGIAYEIILLLDKNDPSCLERLLNKKIEKNRQESRNCKEITVSALSDLNFNQDDYLLSIPGFEYAELLCPILPYFKVC